MLDPKITEIARTMIRVRFDECREHLRRDIDIAFSKLAADGLLSLGLTVRTVHELCTNDLKLRASIVWESLSRVLSTIDIKPSDELALDLKKEVENYLTSVLDELNQTVEENVKHVGTSHLPSLRGDWNRTMVQIGTEIDLFVHSLSRAKEKGQSDFPQNVYNFNVPVGAVQTGQGSTANVTQIIGSDDQEALLQAFDVVEKYIKSGATLSGFTREEVLELVEESRVEVNKPNPNGTRLKTSLMSIAVSIQTVAGLKPAYEVIKFALSHFHIILP